MQAMAAAVQLTPDTNDDPHETGENTNYSFRMLVMGEDAATTTVRLAEKIDAKKRIRFEVESKNQNGETVMIGELLEQCL